jgi:quercetin dioxygenase-like cupin family protein
LQNQYIEVMPGVRSRLLYCSDEAVVIEALLEKGAVVPRHSHTSLQVSFCRRGLLELKIGDKTVVMKPGDLQVIPPGVEHEARALEETVVVDINAPFTEDRKGLVEKLRGCQAAQVKKD